MPTRAALLLLFLLFGGCSNVERIALGQCGNGIVEEGETCDGSSNCTAQCQLSCDAKRKCPAGLGCDVSAGQCRAASGEFTPGPALGSSATYPAVADFDGNGRDDLLLVGGFETASTPSSVYFFESGAVEPKVVTLPRAGYAAAANFTGDAATDVVLADSSLLAYSGSTRRRFSPIVSDELEVASDAQLYAADFDCDGLREFALLEGKTLTIVRSPTEMTRNETELDDGFEAEVSVVVSYENSEGKRCEGLALTDGSRLVVFGGVTIFRDQLQQQTSLPIPTGVFGSLTLLSADIDLDGVSDVILFEGTSPDPYVARGVGHGTYEPFVVRENCDCFSLAVGHFDNAPELDFFSGTGPISGSGISKSYHTALVADFTGDARDDIAASELFPGPSFDVLRSHPSGLFSSVQVATTGTAQVADSGDLDGDDLADVILKETIGELAAGTDWVSAAYSPLVSDGSSAQLLAQIPRIRQVVAAHLEPNGTTDVFADVGVLHETEFGDLKLVLLEGGRDRVLRSPFSAKKGGVSVGPILDVTQIPLFGHFRDDETDLVTLRSPGTTDDPPELELLTIDANGAASLGKVALPKGTDVIFAQSADLDLDGLDELYLLQEDDKPLLQIRISGGGATPLQAMQTPIVFPPERGLITTGDADGDGNVDLIALGEAGMTVLLAREAAVPKALRISLPAEACQLFKAQAWLQTDTTPEHELVVNCMTNNVNVLHTFRVDLETGELTLLPRSRPGLDSYYLAVGDFNGDGLQDLASTSTEVTVLYGTARR